MPLKSTKSDHLIVYVKRYELINTDLIINSWYVLITLLASGEPWWLHLIRDYRKALAQTANEPFDLSEQLIVFHSSIIFTYSVVTIVAFRQCQRCRFYHQRYSFIKDLIMETCLPIDWILNCIDLSLFIGRSIWIVNPSSSQWLSLFSGIVVCFNKKKTGCIITVSCCLASNPWENRQQ